MILVRGLSKVFGNSAESKMFALRDINLEIQDGELVVILGHSGAGKTTLINILSTLDMPTLGSVEYNGVNICTMKNRKLIKFRQAHVAFIFQQFHLLPMLTVEKNIQVAATLVKASKDEIEQMIHNVGLTGKKYKYPFQLSGGEQQRVAIARALIKRPKVLFCDEPTGALDEYSGYEILNLISKLTYQHQATVFIVSHNPIVGNLADRMITMKNGRIYTNSVRKATHNHG